MVNYKLVLQGTGLYITGFLGSLIGGYILSPLLDGLSTFANGASYDTTLQGIGWLGLIIIWILSTIVVPLAIVVQGLMEEQEGDTNPTPTLLSVTGGVLWAIFTILIFYFVSKAGMITALADNIPTSTNNLLIDASGSAVDFTLLLILFWMSVAATIISNVFIVPGYIIAKYRGS